MAWNQIIGQRTVVEMLQRSISSQRVPQALLLSGEDGAGALGIAIAMAQTLVCETPRIDEHRIDNCGTCQSCIQSRSLQHPNIKLVTALPTGKGDTEDSMTAAVLEELADLIAAVAQDPYESLTLTKATQIKIGQIRELKRTLSLSSAQGGRRIVIINHAEEMTVGAANAFLKTLEEPHADVTLILTSSKSEQLLQTIVSRCQEVIIPPLADEDIIDALVDEGAADLEGATLIAPFAEGNLVRARNIIADDVATERLDSVELLRSSLRGRQFRIALLKAVRPIASSRDKTKAIRSLTLLALWIRDAEIVRVVGPDAKIVNLDQRDALERFASSFPNADLNAVLKHIEEAVRDLYRNVAITSVLVTTMMKARQVIIGGRVKKADTPA